MDCEHTVMLSCRLRLCDRRAVATRKQGATRDRFAADPICVHRHRRGSRRSRLCGNAASCHYRHARSPGSSVAPFVRSSVQFAQVVPHLQGRTPLVRRIKDLSFRFWSLPRRHPGSGAVCTVRRSGSEHRQRAGSVERS